MYVGAGMPETTETSKRCASCTTRLSVSSLRQGECQTCGEPTSTAVTEDVPVTEAAPRTLWVTPASNCLHADARCSHFNIGKNNPAKALDIEPRPATDAEIASMPLCGRCA
jgi:hypothetical protein